MDSISEILQGFEFASAHTQTFSANTTKIEGGFSRLFQDLFGKTTIKTEYNKQKETDNSKTFDGFNPFVTNHDLATALENRFRESFAERIKTEQKSAADKANLNKTQKEVANKPEIATQAVKNTTTEKPEQIDTKKETAETEEKTEKTSSETENPKKNNSNETENDTRTAKDTDKKNTDKKEPEIDNKEKATAEPEAENTKESNSNNEKNAKLDTDTADGKKVAEPTTENAETETTTVEISIMPEVEVPVTHTEAVSVESVENNGETTADVVKNTSITVELIPSAEQTEQTEQMEQTEQNGTDTKTVKAESNQEAVPQKPPETKTQPVITTDLTENESTETALNIQIEKPVNPDTENQTTNQSKTENKDQKPVKIENTLPIQEEIAETATPQIIPAENTEKKSAEKPAGEIAAQIETEDITDKIMKFATLQPEKLMEEPEFRELMVNLVDKIQELAESTGLAEQIETETTISADEFFDLLKDYFENPQPEKLANLEKSEFSQWHKLADTLKNYSVLQWSTESVEMETIANALRKISPDLNPLSMTENTSTEDIARMNAIARMTLKINSESQETNNTEKTDLTSVETEIVEESTEKHQDNSSDKREHHHNGGFLSAGTKMNMAKAEKTALKFSMPVEGQNNMEKVETALGKGRENSLSGMESSAESARNLSKSTMRGFATESNLLVRQIMEQARKLNPPKLNTIRIILKPESLGQLRLSVSKETNIDGFRVNFTAETTAAKEMIERNINQIRDSLKNQGINANSIDVELSGENEKRNFSHRGARKKKWGKTKVETIETGAAKRPEAMNENIVNRYA